MEPLPIMLFSFMFGFPLYRIVPLPAILVDIALFAVISIWVLPAALQVSSSVSRPNALILLLTGDGNGIGFYSSSSCKSNFQFFAVETFA